ncbi:MAG: penicillin-binding protein 2 [Cytophagales bacterium]|nr:penicillin-binding protein 2 [Armatimonadota bacterium]
MSQPLRRFRPAVPVAPLSDTSVPVIRLRLFALLLVALIFLLLARMWYLQILRGDEFHEKALANQMSPVRSPAPRGIIQDSKGRPLVINGTQFTIFVSPPDLPKEKQEKAAVLSRLAVLLHLRDDELAKILRRGKGGPSDPVVVAEGVDYHVLSRVSENRLHLPGVAARVEPVRRYPHGPLASHLLGYIGQISESEITDKANIKRGYVGTDFIGKSGVEKQYDPYLNGKSGEMQYEVDARQRRQRLLGELPPRPGATLTLGLDLEVQKACEAALAGRNGAAVALDPRDGHVIAMASYPAFDPNLLARRPLLQRVYDQKIAPGLFNRATMAAQPPGSTFKIITSAAGLATGEVTAHTWDNCPGFILLGRVRKRCHSSHGGVNLTRALEASCDVFYYHAALRTGPTRLADWASRFGLGQKTGIDLPVEVRGTVPSPAWKKIMAPKFHNPDSGWYPGDTANMAIGQGDVQATPLQMAQVAAAIANGGNLYEPHVVLKATEATTGKTLYTATPKKTHSLGLRSDQVAQIARGMRQVVIGGGGTGHAADLPGIAVAGKSGSAERRGGQAHGATDAWFVCYAPYEKPTIAICVYLETNGANLHGGADAAPVARKMMAAHFKVGDSSRGVDSGSRAD